MWFSPKHNCDPLLHSYFAAKTAKEAEYSFNLLWTNELCKEAESVLQQRMPGEEEGEKREELVNETGLKLYKELEGQREAQAAWKTTSGQKRVANARAYTRQIARNLFVDYMRVSRPAWRHLNQHVFVALGTHPDLKLWEIKAPHAVKMACLRVWSQPTHASTANAQKFFEGDYADFRAKQLDNQNPSEIVGANEAGLPILIWYVLAWINTPILTNTLMFHLAQLLELTETRFDSLEEWHERGAQTQDHGQDTIADLLKQMAGGEKLRQMGNFMCETDRKGALTRCEKGAVLLNLDQKDILDKLQISPSRLAQALDFPSSPPARFQFFREEIWRKLPLADADIKKVLVAEQTVSNCRMTARRKLEKWWEEQKRHEEQSQ